MLPEQIVSKIGAPDENGCWPWIAARTKAGYSWINWRCKPQLAHRVIYELIVGPIPEGLQIDHLCRVRHCVNPAHLEPVTNRENGLRGVSPAALHAAQTHCKNGHEFTPDNTLIRRKPKFARVCATCKRAADRAHYEAGRGTRHHHAKKEH